MFVPRDEIIVGNPKYYINDNGDGTYDLSLANTVEQEASGANRTEFATCIGMDAKNTTFNDDGSITETDGTTTKTTTFNSDGSITEYLEDEFSSIEKKTIFNEDGTIDEIILTNGGN